MAGVAGSGREWPGPLAGGFSGGVSVGAGVVRVKTGSEGGANEPKQEEAGGGLGK